MNYIIDGIYIGNFDDANDRSQLIKNNIQIVINVTQFKPTQHLELEYHWFNIYDEPTNNISRYFEKANGIITKAKKDKKRILVHCQEGQSRSVTIVMSYLIANYKCTRTTNVLTCIQTKRKQANPNHGFMEQLEVWRKSQLL